MIKSRGTAGVLFLFIMAVSIAGTGCNAFTRTQRGAAIGAGAGATVGGFIGKFAGNTALGSIIGGAVGGTAGAFIGRNIDKQAVDIDKMAIPGAVITPEGTGFNVRFNQGILFDAGKAGINPDVQANLKDLAEALKKSPQANVNIIGHTDNKEGTIEDNIGLSSKRADSVKAYIILAGIDSSRLIAMGKGRSTPLADNNTDAGRALNRRVDIIIVANEQAKSQAAVNPAKN